MTPCRGEVGGPRAGALGREEAEVLLALAVRGPATADQVADSLGSAAVRSALSPLAGRGLVAVARSRGTLWALTDDGRRLARTVLAQERVELGALTERAYAGFAVLNRRVKEAIGAWQMRRVGGVQVVNDHLDARYDGEVLAELTDVAVEAATILAELARARDRYRAYRERLDRAARRARGGEWGWVAGLDVDSFHSVWWQLHADLLALLDRDRQPEDA